MSSYHNSKYAFSASERLLRTSTDFAREWRERVQLAKLSWALATALRGRERKSTVRFVA